MVKTKTEFLFDERESETSTTAPPGIIQPIAMIGMNIVAAAILNRTHTSGTTQIVEIATDNERIGTIAKRIGNRTRFKTAISIAELQLFVNVVDFLPFTLALAHSCVIRISAQVDMNQSDRLAIDICCGLIDNHIASDKLHIILIQIWIVAHNPLHIQTISPEITKRKAAVDGKVSIDG